MPWQHVGKVWSGVGDLVATTSESLTFVGIAEQRAPPPKPRRGEKEKRPQLRRFALVGLNDPDNKRLTWAELVTKDAGLILCLPPHSKIKDDFRRLVQSKG